MTSASNSAAILPQPAETHGCNTADLLLTLVSFAESRCSLPKVFGNLASMDNEADGIDRLARIVKRRREELGLRQDQLAERGGPSTTTLTKVENGVGLPANVTLRKLDTALGWYPGSAQRVLDGGNPLLATATIREVADAGFPPALDGALTRGLARLIPTSPDGGRGAESLVGVALSIASELTTTATAIDSLELSEDSGWQRAVREHTRHLDELAIRVAELAIALSRSTSDPTAGTGSFIQKAAEAFQSNVGTRHDPAEDDLEARRNQQAAAADIQWPAPDTQVLIDGPLANVDDEGQAPDRDRQLAARRGESEEKRRRRLTVEPEDESQDHGQGDLE